MRAVGERLASLLDQAGREGRVQIRRQDGSTFVLQPVVPTTSPQTGWWRR